VDITARLAALVRGVMGFVGSRGKLRTGGERESDSLEER
jgi:hypothetical protein